MTKPKPRSTYRHGDLRRALLDAGIELARDGGPDAVVLREATRRAGVVPNAAYRHFASRHALLVAVRAAALSAVAVAEAGLVPVAAIGGRGEGHDHEVTHARRDVAVAAGAQVDLDRLVGLHLAHVEFAPQIVGVAIAHPTSTHSTQARAISTAATTNTMSERRTTCLR